MTVPTATQPRLDEVALTALQGSLRGRLLRPEDDGYDEARAVYNAMIDRVRR